MARKKQNDLDVSAGFSVDTAGLVQLKDYLKRATTTITSAATAMNNAFASLDVAFKNIDTSGPALTDIKSADLGGNINNTAREMSRSADSIGKSGERIAESNKKVQKSFELIDAVAVSVFRRILKFSTNIYRKLAMAGSNMTETNSRFNYILGGLAEQAEDYAEIIANAYAITETAAKTSITKVYQLATSSGIASKNALEMAKSVTILGAELSSVWDVPTEQAVNALISAMQGLPKAGKNLSLYLNVSEIKTVLQEAGIAVEGTLTQEQKVLGTFLKSLKDAGYAIGDFGRTQTSVANQLRLIDTAVTSLSENIGAAINTVLGPLLQIVNFFLKMLVRVTNILNDMPEPLKFVVGIFATFAIAIPIVVSLFVLLTRVKQIYTKQVYSLYRALLQQNGAMNKTVKLVKRQLIPSFITAGKMLIPLVVFIGSLIGLVNQFSKASDDAANNIENFNKANEDSAKTLAGYDDVNVLSFDGSSGGFNEEYWKMIEEQLVGTNESITETGNSMIWLYSVMMATSGVYAITQFVKNWKSLKDVIFSVPGLLKKAKDAIVSLAKGVTLSGTMIAAGIAVAIGGFYLLIQAFSVDWEDQTKGFVAAISSMIAMIGGLIFALGVLKHNYVMAGIGGLLAVGGLGTAITMFATDEGASSSFSVLPGMAHGGVATGPTRALVGEGMYNEAVIPLGNSAEFASMKNDITNAVVAGLMSAGGSNGNINITVNVDEDYIYKAYNRQKALRGGN